MTALDQAFIKAFARQNTCPLAVSPRPAAPNSGERRARNEEQPSLVASRSPEAAPVSAVVRPPEQPGNVATTPRRLPLGVAVSLSQSAAAAQSTSSLPTVDSIWAALEKMPQPPVSPSRPKETIPRAAKEEPSEKKGAGASPDAGSLGSPLADSEPVPVFSQPHSEQWTVGSDQWTLDTGQWTLGIGQWAETSASPAAVVEPERPSIEPVSRDSAVETRRAPEVRPTVPSIAPLEAPVSPVPPPSVASMPAVSREFHPARQVDHFTWPRICRRLISCAAEELDRLADALLAVHREGDKVLGIGGCHRGEGTTTMLLCAARRLAERGMKLALVDADLGRPQLADRLGLQPQLGWNETTEEEGQWLDRAIIEAAANNAALLPAREPSDENGRPAGDLSRLPACLEILRDHYDIVLVDLGPLENAGLARGAWEQLAGGMIDSVVLVHNRRITSDEDEVAFEGKLALAGIHVAGIVENFVTED